jgi:hypothetical protein
MNACGSGHTDSPNLRAIHLHGLGLSRNQLVWYSENVKLRLAIPRLLAAFAILGLLLAPLAGPATAMPAGTMTMADDHGAMDMSADMPCCPNKGSLPDCAKDCPLMALCLAGSVLNLPASGGLLMPLELASLVFPGNEPGLPGLNHGPPPRPPKT